MKWFEISEKYGFVKRVALNLRSESIRWHLGKKLVEQEEQQQQQRQAEGKECEPLEGNEESEKERNLLGKKSYLDALHEKSQECKDFYLEKR